MRFAWAALVALTVAALLIPQVGGAQQGTYTLTVSVKGNGTVATSTGGISCPGTCTATFQSGAIVYLTATPKGSDSFDEWRDDCQGTSPNCQVIMATNRVVEGRFTGSGGTTPSPTSTTSATATATTSTSPTATATGTPDASPTSTGTPGTIAPADRRRLRRVARSLADVLRQAGRSISVDQRSLRAVLPNGCPEDCTVEAVLGNRIGTDSARAGRKIVVRVKLSKKLRRRLNRAGEATAKLRLTVIGRETTAAATVERRLTLTR